MVYSSDFGGASTPPSLGTGECHADAQRRLAVFGGPPGSVICRPVGECFRASEATPTTKEAMGEGNFDFQGAGAGVDSARDCGCDLPRGFTVWRIRGIFGSERRPAYSDSATDDSKPFNPKRITYEVWGPPGSHSGHQLFRCQRRSAARGRHKLPWTLKPDDEGGVGRGKHCGARNQQHAGLPHHCRRCG